MTLHACGVSSEGTRSVQEAVIAHLSPKRSATDAQPPGCFFPAPASRFKDAAQLPRLFGGSGRTTLQNNDVGGMRIRYFVFGQIESGSREHDRH